MSKRRTRKDKERANYSFLLSWSGGSKTKASERDVKRQFENKFKVKSSKLKVGKSADILVKEVDLASQKKDIVKSLGLASFILSIELVIYLAL